MKKRFSFLMIFFLVILANYVLAAPTIFYGTPRVNGVTVITGTNISLYVDGVYSTSVPANSSAANVYQIECPHGDDKTRNATFKINNLTADGWGFCDYLTHQIDINATDSTPPGVSITSPSANQILNSKEVPINGTSSDSGYGLSHTNISIYNSAGSLINSTVENQTFDYVMPWFVSLHVSVDGNYTINATAYDLAGNSNSDTVNITVDTTAPASFSFVPPTEGDYANKSQDWYYVNVTFTEANPDTCWLDNGATNTSMSGSSTTNCYVNITNQSEATHTYKVWANDTAGNWGVSSERHITLDTTAPTLAITTSNNTLSNTLTTIEGTASDTNADTIYSNNTAWTWNNTYANWKFTNNTNIADGTYHILITADDTAGNTKSSLFNFTYDSTAPAVTVSSSAGASTTASSTTISGNATDSESGILNVTVNGNNATLNASTGAYSSAVSLSIGSNLITVIAYDQAGNNVTNTSVTVTRTSSDGGSTGGGGGGTTTTTTVISFTTAGVNVSLSANNIAKFAFEGAYHTIKVIKVGANYVTLEIASDPVTVTLNLLESKKLDLNNDNYYDLYVKLNEIKSSKAYLEVKYIHEIIKPVVAPPAEEEEPEEVPEELPEEVIEEPEEEATPEEEEIPPAKPNTAMIIVLIIALLALIGFLIYEKKKRY